MNPTDRCPGRHVLVLGLLVFALLALAAPQPAPAGSSLTRLVLPISGTGENLCIHYNGSDQELGDDGEFFDYSGTVTITTLEMTDGAGGRHRIWSYQYQGVSGSGSVSGLRYELTGGSRIIDYVTGDFSPLTQTQVANTQFVV